jgi:crotonobetaine/carnitine-CoA ligase
MTMDTAGWFDPDPGTLTGMLLRQAEADPGKVGLTILGEDVTYAGLVDRMNSFARGLRDLGVGRGDVVAIFADNSAEHVFVQFAVWRLSAIEVMINTAYRGEFMARQIRDAGVRVLVVDRSRLPLVTELSDVPSVRAIVVIDGDLDEFVADSRVLDVSCLRDQPTHSLSDVADPSWTDACSLAYTSGTTGPSKAAVLSQSYLCSVAQLQSSVWYRNPGDSFYSCGPLFHLAAKGMGVLGAIYRGARCVQDDRFSASAFWSRVREEGCNSTLLLGSMSLFLWARDPRADEGIDLIVSVPVPETLQAAMEERWSCTFHSCYGLSEACPVAKSGADVPLRRGSAGKIVSSHYDVRIFDDDDRELPPGSVGEVVIRPRRARVMFDGYFENDAATKAVWRNLWFHSGDFGKVDEDGYFYFMDRKKDYLRRRGENISSWEVESAIVCHPGVLEVAVVGVKSELMEDEVKASVILRPGIQLTYEEFIDYCIDNMPFFAVPRYVEFVEDLPRVASGKVAKEQLRLAGHEGLWDREAAGIVLSGRKIAAGNGQK